MFRCDPVFYSFNQLIEVCLWAKYVDQVLKQIVKCIDMDVLPDIRLAQLV